MKSQPKLNLSLIAVLALLPILGQAYIQWSDRAPMPIGVSHFGCETYNGLVYCFGGSLIWSTDSMTSANQVFNPVTNSWSNAAPMLYKRKSFAAAAINNIFYAAGGIDTAYVGTPSVLAEAYNASTNTWAPIASMAVARYGCCAAAVGGRVYVFGGETGPAGYPNTNANEEYNPGTNTWQTRAPMPESLRYCGAVSYNNLIYVYGGSRNSGVKNENVYVYNPGANTWSTAPGTMPTPRSTLMPDSLRNFMLTVGGAYGSSTETNVAECYYPGSGSWLTETPMNYARYGNGFVRVDSFVYCFGGTYSSGEYPYNYSEGGLYIYCALTVNPDQSDSILPGATRAYTLTVTNLGDHNDVIDITSSGTLPGWTVAFYQSNNVDTLTDTDGDGVKDVGSVPRQGGTRNFVARVTSPGAAPAGQTDVTTVWGTSSIDINATDNAVLTTRVRGVTDIIVIPDTTGSTLPAAAVNYLLRVVNNGNLADTVNLTTFHTSAGWTAQLLDSAGAVTITRVPVAAFGGTTRFTLRVTPDDTVAAGFRDTTYVRGVSAFNTAEMDTARVITVINGFAGVLVDPDTLGFTSPAVAVTYTLRAVNNGNVSDTFNLTSSGTKPGWTAQLLDTLNNPITYIAVPPYGGLRRFRLRVDPPDTVNAGARDTTTVRGTSRFNGAVFDNARVITEITGFASILVEPDTSGSTLPGVAVNYSLRAVNNGNVPDTVNLSSFHTSAGWTAQILDSAGASPITRLAVSPYGGVRRFTLRITPDDTVVAGFRDTTYVRGLSTYNGSVRDSCRVITVINGFAGVLVEPDTSATTLPGIPVTYTMRVTNNGNVNDTFNLATSGTKPGWTAQLLDTLNNPIAYIAVPPYGGMRRMRVRIDPPDTVNAGVRDTTTLRGTSRFNAAVYDNARLITIIAGFADFQVEPDTAAGTSPGVAVNYPMRVINNGNQADTINLAAAHTLPLWTAQILDSTGASPITRLAVDPWGGVRRFILRITPDDTVVAGTQDTTFVRGTSTFNGAVRDSARVITAIGSFASIIIAPDTVGFTNPGAVVNYGLRAINNGNVPDTVNLSSFHTSAGWTAQIMDSTGSSPITRLPLNPYGGLRHFILRVTPDDTVAAGFRDTTYVRGTSTYSPTTRDSAEVITVINGFAGVLLDPDTLGTTGPGIPITYLMRVTNNGNVSDTFNLTSSGTKPGWTAEITDTLNNPIPYITVPPYGGLRRFRLRITPPDSVNQGVRDTTTVRGTSRFNGAVFDNARVITEITGFASILVEPDTSGSTQPGVAVNYSLRAVNNGNVPDTVNLSSFHTSVGWTAQILDSAGASPITRLAVGPYGGMRRFILRVDPPDSAVSGSLDTTFVRGISTYNSAVRDSARVITGIGSFAAIEVNPDTVGYTNPGAVVNYQMRAVNNGNVPDTVNLSSFHTSAGWTAQILDSTGSSPITRMPIAPYGGTRRFLLRITPEDTVAAGFRDTTYVRGTSTYSPTTRDSAEVITVINGFAGIVVEPDTGTSTLPAVAVTYNLRVHNNGNVLDTVDLASAGTKPGWTCQVTDTLNNPISRLVVPPYGGLGRVRVRIDPPDTVNAGAADTTTLTGTSSFNPSVSDNSRLITQILAVADLAIVPDTAAAIDPGDTIRYYLRVTNNGNASERAAVTLASVHPTGWTSQVFDTLGLPIDTVFLAPWGETKRVVLRVSAPASAGSSERDTSVVTVRSSVLPSLTDQATVVTRIGMTAMIIVDPDQQQNGLPRDILPYRLAVDNLGSAADIIDFTLSSTQGWALASITDTLNVPLPDSNNNGHQDLTLASGARGWIVVRIQIPSGAPSGAQDVTTVLGESNNIAGVSDDARLTTRVLSEVLSMVVEPDNERTIPALDTFRYPLYVIVSGNSPVTVDLSVSAPPGAWRTEVRNLNDQVISHLPVQPGDSTPFQLFVVAPAVTIVGPISQIFDSCVSVISGSSRLNDSISDIATVITHVVPGLDVHNFSSPFRVRDNTTFIMSLPEAGLVTITVYNRLGEKVRTVAEAQAFQAGVRTLAWDGLNDAGKRLSPGVYLYVFKFDSPNFRDRVIKKKTAIIAD